MKLMMTVAYRMHKERNCVSKKLTEYRFVQKIKINNGRHCSKCLHYYKFLTVTQSLLKHKPNMLRLINKCIGPWSVEMYTGHIRCCHW